MADDGSISFDEVDDADTTGPVADGSISFDEVDQLDAAPAPQGAISFDEVDKPATSPVQAISPEQVAAQKPRIPNPDGSVSTERTIGIEMDGKHYVLPTIVGGKPVTAEEAVRLFREGTNKALGEFATRGEADRFARTRTDDIGRAIQPQPTGRPVPEYLKPSEPRPDTAPTIPKFLQSPAVSPKLLEPRPEMAIRPPGKAPEGKAAEDGETLAINDIYVTGRTYPKFLDENKPSPYPNVNLKAYRSIEAAVDIMTPEQIDAVWKRTDLPAMVAQSILQKDLDYQANPLETPLAREAREKTGAILPDNALQQPLKADAKGHRLRDRVARLEAQGNSREVATSLARQDIRWGIDRSRGNFGDVNQFEFKFDPEGMDAVVQEATDAGGSWNSGVVGAVGSTLSYTGRSMNAPGMAELGDAMTDWATKQMPEDPTFAHHLVSAFGSTTSFFVPGVGVMKGMDALAVLSPLAAKWGGAGAMAIMEAAAEGDQVYKTLVAQGVPHSVATEKASGAFWANVPVIMVTDKLAFFSDAKDLSTRVMKGAVLEGPLQEGPQQVIQNFFTARPLKEGVGEASAIGSIVGGGMTLVQGLAGEPGESTSPPPMLDLLRTGGTGTGPALPPRTEPGAPKGAITLAPGPADPAIGSTALAPGQIDPAIGADPALPAQTEPRAPAKPLTVSDPRQEPPPPKLKAPEAIRPPADVFMTKEELAEFAERRYQDLKRKNDGSTMTVPDPVTGKPRAVVEQPQFFTPEEQAEYKFLTQSRGDVNKIAEAYNVGIQSEPVNAIAAPIPPAEGSGIAAPAGEPSGAPAIAPPSDLTHELPSGTQVRPYLEDGEQIPDLWEDAEGNLIEATDAKPIEPEVAIEEPVPETAIPDEAAPAETQNAIVTPDEKGQVGKEPADTTALRAAFDRYDDTGESTLEDLVEDVDALIAEGNAPESLQAAVDTYRDESDYDRELGGRGDMDTAEEAFISAVRAALEGKVATPEQTKEEKEKAKKEAKFQAAADKRKKKRDDLVADLTMRMERDGKVEATLPNIPGRRLTLVKDMTGNGGYRVLSMDGATPTGTRPYKTIEGAAEEFAEAKLRNRTQKEIAKKRAAKLRRIDKQTDSITDAIIKMGGISMDSRLDISRDTNINKKIPFVGALFTTKGRGVDDMASRLHAEGYLTDEEINDVDGGVQALKDKIADEIDGGFTHYSMYRDPNLDREEYYADDAAQDEADFNEEGMEYTAEHAANADLVAAAYAMDPEATESIVAGYSYNTTELIDAIQELIDENTQTDDGRGEVPADREEAPEPGSQAEESADSESAGPAQAVNRAPEEAEVPGQVEGLELKGETEAEIRAREQAEAADKAKKKRKDEAPSADEFVMTGSDRPADVGAAHGQQDLISVSINGQSDTVNPKPSDAQIDAGNYKKAHITVGGLDITIETPAGQRRDPKWPKLKHSYGYINRTEDNTGENVDVFIGEGDLEQAVYVIDQLKAHGQFDEFKVMLGFDSEAKAKAGYLANYEKDWNGFGGITAMSFADFKEWVLHGDTTKPLSQEQNNGRAGEGTPELGSAIPSPGKNAERAQNAVGPRKLRGVDQHRIHQLADRAGKCFAGAGKTSIKYGHDFLIMVVGNGGGQKIWHAVNIDPNGNIYDYTLDTWWQPGYYEKTQKAEPVIRMTSEQVGVFMARTGFFPDPVTLALKGQAAWPLKPGDYDVDPRALKEATYVKKAGEQPPLPKKLNPTRVYSPTADRTKTKQQAPISEVTDLTMPLDDFREITDEWAELFADPDQKVSLASDDKYMSVEAAEKKLAEWKEHVTKQGIEHGSENAGKTVLSLFDITGEWSKPWREAGYNVITMDLQSGQDVMDFSVEWFNDNYDFSNVYAILAACPCTDFAVSGARHFARKDADGSTEQSKELVFQTLRTIEYFRPAIWALENPVSRIEKLTGLPKARLIFNPNNFGDPYTKRTVLWGKFEADLPTANVEPTEGSKMWSKYGGKSEATKNARSATPEGFAYAFFMANNYIDRPAKNKLTDQYPEASGAVQAALDAGVTEERIHELMEWTYGNYEYQEARDALVKEVAEVTKGKGVAKKSRKDIPAEIPRRGMEKLALQAWVNRLSFGMNSPRVEVVNNVSELPPQLADTPSNARAVFDDYTGITYMIAENLAPLYLEEVFLHEMVGHVGLRRLLGDEALNTLLDQIYRSRSDDIKKAEWFKRYNLDLRRPGDRRIAAEEFLAHIAPNSKDISLWKQFVALVRRALRAAGFVKHFSDNDIADLLRRSKASLYNLPPNPTNGGPRYNIDAEPGVNFERLNKLLGAKLYGEPSDIASVSVKEMVQNSFDAIKALIDKGELKTGSIDIDVDVSARTITLRDNGSGMTAKTLATKFLQIAGTQKETERSSGGLGIAKGLFLYGNERIQVITTRDGITSTLNTTGVELVAATAGGKPPRVITEPALVDRGTYVKVTIPKTYVEVATGETKEIQLSDYASSYPVLNESPLFSDINVRFNGYPLAIGNKFPAQDFGVFATVKFLWGNATIYIGKKDNGRRYGENLRVLSNGLWQFGQSLSKDPFDPYTENIRRDVYVDVHPTVAADEPGYPFALSRKEFTPAVRGDFVKVLQYLQMAYSLESVNASASNYGVVRHLDDHTGKLGAQQKLAPVVSETTKSKMMGVVAGDVVKVEEGRLVVNGRAVPELTKDTIGDTILDLKSFKIPQDQIDPDALIYHDNAIYEDPNAIGGLFGEKETSLDDMAAKKFGRQRIDRYMRDVALAFRNLRDVIAQEAPAGWKLNDLDKVPVGISFDKTYYGVNVMVPYRMILINAGLVEDTRPAYQGSAMFLTMIHEFAHHTERDHDARFADLMGRIQSLVRVTRNMEAIQDRMIQIATDNMDIITYVSELQKDDHTKPRGTSFKDGSYSSGTGRDAGGDLQDSPGGRAQREQGTQPVREGTGASDRNRQGQQVDRGLPGSRARYALGDPIPAKVRAAHERAMAAEAAMSEPSEIPSGELKRRATVANNALVRAAREATGGDENAALKMMRELRNEPRARYALGPPDTPAFRKWFGDSKVVDANGRPLIVYHGTKEDFTEFRATRSGEFGSAIYLTDSPREAGEYGDGKGWGGPVGTRIMPVYVSLQNPWTEGVDAFWARFGAADSDDAAVARAKAAGYDGVIATRKDNYYDNAKREWVDRGGVVTHYVVFSNTQVKSAVGNRGTYDPKNPDIRFALGPGGGIREVFGIRGGTVMGYATRRPGNVWEVYLPNNLTTPGWRRVQASSLQEVRQLFNQNNLTFKAKKDAWMQVPKGMMFAPFDLPEHGTVRRFAESAIQKIQDRMRPLKIIQQSINEQQGRIDDDSNAYQKEELYHGIAAGRLEDFVADYVEPITDLMREHKFTVADVDKFLYARHAQERNAKVEEIDPSNKEGSGMSDADAAAILSAASPEMLKIGILVDRLQHYRLNVMEESGLMDRESRLRMEGTYQHYVPLRTSIDELDEDAPRRTGSAFDIRGKEQRRAFGRQSRAGDILAYSIAQVQTSIVRAEKNKVGQSFLKLVQANPHPDLWEINEIEWMPYIDKDGELRYTVDPLARLADNKLGVKVDGKQHIITIHNPDLARAMKTFGASAPQWMRYFSAITNYIALVNTALNPPFVFSNFIRDMQTAGVYLSAERGAAMTAKIAKDIPSAMRGSYRFLRGKDNTHKWQKYFREYSDAGGRVNFLGLVGVEETRQEISNMLKDADPSILWRTRRGIEAVGKLFMDLNGAVENAIRLSVFINLRESGLSSDKAASAAKNVTVNFNRRGELGAAINAFYAFFNANVQGTARMIGALGTNRKVQAAAVAIALMGAAADWWNHLMGGEDDDDESYWDKVPDFERERNIVLMMPDGDGERFKFPLPYGLNIFYVAGSEISGMTHGRNPGKAIGNILSATLNSFNPMGQGDGGWLQMLAPSVLDPFVQADQNKNFFGGKVKPDQPKFGLPVPESELYFPNTPQAYVATSRALNELGGGDEVRPGEIMGVRTDISPNLIQHYIRSLFGGTGQFWSQIATGTHALLNGEEVPLREIPVARIFYSTPNDSDVSKAFYDNITNVKLAEEQVKHYDAKGDRAQALQYRQQNRPWLRFTGKTESAEKSVASMKKEIRAIRSNVNMPEALKKQKIDLLEAKALAIQKDYNKAYNALSESVD